MLLSYCQRYLRSPGYPLLLARNIVLPAGWGVRMPLMNTHRMAQHFLGSFSRFGYKCCLIVLLGVTIRGFYSFIRISIRVKTITSL